MNLKPVQISISCNHAITLPFSIALVMILEKGNEIVLEIEQFKTKNITSYSIP